MRQFVLLLLAVLALAAAPARAAVADPGDLFVNAYMAVQQGEKYEQGGSFKQALTKLRYAATVLDQISTGWPNWQPQIVTYRKQRTAETIARVQEKIARFGAGKSEPPDGLPTLDQPALPQSDDDRPLIFESPDPVLSAPARNTASRSAGSGADSPEPTTSTSATSASSSPRTRQSCRIRTTS